MHKWITLVVLLIAITSSAGEVKMLGSAYDLTDVIVRPLSVGITSWTDDDGTSLAAFGSMCCLSYDNLLRFEAGVICSVQDKLRVAVLTGVSTPIADDYILGAWYAPFWSMTGTDNPWGIMFGYRF